MLALAASERHGRKISCFRKIGSGSEKSSYMNDRSWPGWRNTRWDFSALMPAASSGKVGGCRCCGLARIANMERS